MARGRIFHGWWIVVVAFVCHAVNTGLMFYAWSVSVGSTRGPSRVG